MVLDLLCREPVFVIAEKRPGLCPLEGAHLAVGCFSLVFAPTALCAALTMGLSYDALPDEATN